MHHMSVHVERPWSKKMEITSYFYQNTANSYSGSNLVTIRMWWAMIFYNSVKLYIPFTFGFQLFIGRREKKWEILKIYQRHHEKKIWWYIIWNKNVPVSYSNLIQELWYFFLAGTRVNKHYINKPAIESTKRCKIIFHLRQMVKLVTFCKSLPATGLLYVIHCWLLPHNIWCGNIKNISGQKNRKNPSVFNEF